MFTPRSVVAKAQSIAKAPVVSTQAGVSAVHNGVAWSAPTAVSKISLVQPVGAINSNPWGGSHPFIDFQLPNTIGKLTDCEAELTMTFTTTDASGVDVTVPPTAFLVQKVDVLYAGNSVEPVEAPEIFTEACLWRDSDSLAFNAARWNLTREGGVAPSFNVTSGAPVTKVFYLPLGRGNFLANLQPYLRGFSGIWTYRIYFATSAVISCFQTGSSTSSSLLSVGLPKIQLYATESVLSAAADAALMQAHHSATMYKTIIRSKVTTGNIVSMSSSNTTQVQLSGFNGNQSAGLVMYLQPSNPTIREQLTHADISLFQLKGEGGQEITIPLPKAVFRKAEAHQLPQNAASQANPTNNVLMSFCSNLNSVIESGKYLAHRELSGRETVHIQPASTLSNVTPVFVSYDYATLSVAGGKPSLLRKASA